MAARKKAARAGNASRKGAKTAGKTRASGTAASKAGATRSRRATARKSTGAGSGRKKASRSAPHIAARAAASRQRAKPAAEGASFPEVAALAKLMARHGLLEVDYSSAPDGSTRIHVTRSASGATAPMVEAPVVQPVVAEPAAPAPPAVDEGLHAFKSPMVGTFYRAPSPEAPPFASVGDSIDGTSVVCIIEAMKVMNEISPDAAGEVVSIEVENGEAVEFGQTLMLIRTR